MAVRRKLFEGLLALGAFIIVALVVLRYLEWPLELERTVKVFEGAFYTLSAIAIIVAVLQYNQRSSSQSRHEKYETYVELNNRYLDYVKLLIAHPLLVADEPGVQLPSLSSADSYRQRQIVDYFFCLAEEAYVLREYMPLQQWVAWEAYIRIHSVIPEFREYWYVDGRLKETTTLDRDFEKYIHAIFDGPPVELPATMVTPV